MSTPPATRHPAALAAVAGGLLLVGLGVSAAARPALTDGTGWFLVAAVAAALLTAGILGLRAVLGDVAGARAALPVAAVGMGLFALAHLYVLVDGDTAVVLFSVFMVVTALGLVVAGIAVARARRGPARTIPLLCGVWPLATIPAAAALGDVPHFGAIAVWGLSWIALGAVLRGDALGRDRASAGRAAAAGSHTPRV